MKTALVCAEVAVLEVLEYAHQATTGRSHINSLDKTKVNSVLAANLSVIGSPHRSTSSTHLHLVTGEAQNNG
jgi:hypothetical protein